MNTATGSKPGWAKRPSAKPAAAATSNDPIDDLIRNQAERANGTADTPATKGPAKHISLNMDAALHKRLRQYCVTHDRNVSELLGDLAEKFLASQAD